jgi:hypothetical protein
VRGSLAALCLLLAAPAARAADAVTVPVILNSGPPKTRSLPDFTQEVLSVGADHKVGPPVTDALGLPGEVKTKAIRFKHSAMADKREHAFYVIYETATQGKPTPTGLIWGITKRSMEGSDKRIEITDYLVSLEGELKAAAILGGIKGKVKMDPLDVGADNVKLAFAAERKFYLQETLRLKYSTK